jgi:hypothetical protein
MCSIGAAMELEEKGYNMPNEKLLEAANQKRALPQASDE